MQQNDVFTRFHEIGAAYVKRDEEFLAHALTDDFKFTSAAGRIFNKAERIQAMTSGTRQLEAIHYAELSLREYGDTIILTARFTATFTITDTKTRLTDEGRTTCVFVRQDNEWRLAVQHNSHLSV
jgi:ketosteroid isomerase-like protein